MSTNSKRYQTFLLSFLFLTIATLGSCGGGDSGGDSGPKLTIDYPVEGANITATTNQGFKVTFLGSTAGFKAFLNGSSITELFDSTENNGKMAPFLKVKGAIKDGQNTLKVAVSGFEARVNFTAQILSNAIIITTVESTFNPIPQAGDTVTVSGLSRKSDLESVIANNVSGNVVGNLFNQMTLTIPELSESKDDIEPDITFISEYESGSMHEVNFAVNGRQLNTLGALQVNSNALNVMSPWMQKLIEDRLNDTGIVVGKSGGDKEICSLLPGGWADVYDACEITILGLGDEALSQADRFIPGIDLAIAEKPDEVFPDAVLQIGLRISFNAIKTRFAFYNDVNGTMTENASITTTLPLNDGALEARVLGYENKNDSGFGLEFPANKDSETGEFEETFIFNLDFKDEAPTLACQPTSFCEGKIINLSGTEDNIKAMLEPALENMLTESARTDFKNDINFKTASAIMNLYDQGNNKIMLDNTVKSGVLGTALDANEQNNHGAFLTFGGGTKLFSDGWVEGIVQPVVGSLMTTQAMDFVDAGRLNVSSGMSVAVSANMINQLMMGLYQSGSLKFSEAIDGIEVSGVKVPVIAEVTLKSLPQITFTDTNTIKVMARQVNLDMVAGDNPFITEGTVAAQAILDIEILLPIETEDGRLLLNANSDDVFIRIVDLAIKQPGLEEYRGLIEENLNKEMPILIAAVITNEAKKFSNVGAVKINIANFISGFEEPTKAAIVATLPKVYKLKLSDKGVSIGNDATYIQFSGELEEVADEADADNESGSIFSVGFCNNDSEDFNEIDGCPGKVTQPVE